MCGVINVKSGVEQQTTVMSHDAGNESTHPASQHLSMYLNSCSAETFGESPHITSPSCVSTFAWPYGPEVDQEGPRRSHDECRSGRPFAITEEIVDATQDNISKDCWVKISKLHECFPQLSHGTLFEIVKNCLCYCKLCTR